MDQAVVGGFQRGAILDGFIIGQEFLDQRVDLLEAAHAGAGWIPVPIVGVIDQLGQRQQQAEMIVDVFRRAEFLHLGQHFHHLLNYNFIITSDCYYEWIYFNIYIYIYNYSNLNF